MQFDAITAGSILILVQLCVSLVMAGIFYTLPSEKCTRYWALSGFLIAIGLAMVILNAGAPRYAILIIGNNLLILGMIFQWCGFRAFYRKPPSLLGAWVGLAFFVCFGLALILQASVATRGLLSASAILIMLGLYLYELLTGPVQRHSFASRLAIGSVGLLAIGYFIRVTATAFHVESALPHANTALSVTLIYLLPIAGTLMLSNASILLYFERIVADKHYLATHDELTKVFNRRAIDAAGEREVALAKRLGMPLAVGIVDVDHFKLINDQFGHAVGDLALFEVAQVLKKTCRNIDLIGRYGGEEFCIVFPNMDLSACQAVGERMVTAVNQHNFAVTSKITVSIGFAMLSLNEGDWHTLVRTADEALYQAKGGGRDQFVIAKNSIQLLERAL